MSSNKKKQESNSSSSSESNSSSSADSDSSSSSESDSSSSSLSKSFDSSTKKRLKTKGKKRQNSSSESEKSKKSAQKSKKRKAKQQKRDDDCKRKKKTTAKDKQLRKRRSSSSSESRRRRGRDKKPFGDRRQTRFDDKKRSGDYRSYDDKYKSRRDQNRGDRNYSNPESYGNRSSYQRNYQNPKWGDQKPFKKILKLTEEATTSRGVVMKYTQPPDACKPNRRWRLYPFKGNEALEILYIHRESAYLIGRDRHVVDLPVDHSSCSKQHAVLQYRFIRSSREYGGSGVRPFLIDLNSTNGTFINNKKIEPYKYYELFEKDVIKFAFSSREYVLLHEDSKDGDVEEKEKPVVVKKRN